MKLLMPYSKKWREINRLPTLEHEEFFELLIISPSYQLATAIKKGSKEPLLIKNNPLNFDKVLQIYDLVGDVTEILFDQWWIDMGQHLFFETHSTGLMNISIDISRDKKDLLDEIERIIDEAKQRTKSLIKIPLIKNKIQYKSISSRINLVHDLAAKRSVMPNFEYWRIAVFTGLKSKFTKGLKVDAKKTESNLLARERLTELVTKHLREALYFSENAARGKFPSNTPINSGLDFDLRSIREIGLRQAKKERNYFYEKRKKGEQRLNDSQRRILKRLNKQKVK